MRGRGRKRQEKEDGSANIKEKGRKRSGVEHKDTTLRCQQLAGRDEGEKYPGGGTRRGEGRVEDKPDVASQQENPHEFP